MSDDGPLGILIVDDEPLGRRAVARQVEKLFPHARVLEAVDGFDALEKLRSERVSLVFLDVEMPELSGFDVLRQLPSPRPKVVFVTAFQEFALKAFEENACDYLVKPFTSARFAAAAARVMAEIDAEARLRALERSLAGGGEHMTRLALRLGTRVDVVAVRDVSCFVSREHYTYVYAGDREYLTELTLIHLAERLDPEQFWRVHRAALVNASAVVRVIDGPPPEVELVGGRRVPLSRRHRSALLDRLKRG